MKKTRFIYSLALILFFQISQAQLIMIDGETGEYSYEEVVTANGKSQNDILNRANDWVQKYYPDQLKLKLDSTSVSLVGNTPISWNLINKNIDITVFYNIEIKTKNGKYKYKFDSFREGKTIRGEIDAHDLKTYIERFPQRYQILVEEPIDNEITWAIESLKYYVEHGSMQKEDDDW